MQWAILEKSKLGGVQDVFFKRTTGIFSFVTLPLKFLRKQYFTPGKSTKLCYTIWKFQDQKPRSVNHDFLLDHPWHALTPPPPPPSSSSWERGVKNFRKIFAGGGSKFIIGGVGEGSNLLGWGRSRNFEVKIKIA